MFYSLQKISQLYDFYESRKITLEDIQKKIQNGVLPAPRKGRGGFGWDSAQMHLVSMHFSPLRRAEKARVATIFVTKGGVLKTTLTLNLARIYALNGIKTLVIGLDLQSDITAALGFQSLHSVDSLSAAMQEVNQTRGLFDHFTNQCALQELIQKTDLENLDLIPETPELISLDQALVLKTRRENWLQDRIIKPLLPHYDLILLDCSPNWNQLISNALVASDLLISPLECRVNNYRNLRLFLGLVQEARQELSLDFEHIFVPTKLNSQRKLSCEIEHWYRDHLKNCTKRSIRESLIGEEASALHLSIAEHAPETKAAEEIKLIALQIWDLICSGRKEHHHQAEKEILCPSV